MLVQIQVQSKNRRVHDLRLLLSSGQRHLFAMFPRRASHQQLGANKPQGWPLTSTDQKIPCPTTARGAGTPEAGRVKRALGWKRQAGGSRRAANQVGESCWRDRVAAAWISGPRDAIMLGLCFWSMSVDGITYTGCDESSFMCKSTADRGRFDAVIVTESSMSCLLPGRPSVVAAAYEHPRAYPKIGGQSMHPGMMDEPIINPQLSALMWD